MIITALVQGLRHVRADNAVRFVVGKINLVERHGHAHFVAAFKRFAARKLELAAAELNGVFGSDFAVVFVYRLQLFHDVYAVGLYGQPHRFAHRAFHGVLHGKLIARRHYFHFVISALEHGGNDFAFERAFFRIDRNVLRTHDKVNAFVFAEALVGALELRVAELDQKILFHYARKYVALADKVGDKRVGRLVVNLFGRAVLLNRAVGHDDHFVGHGKGFLLIVRDVNKSNAYILVHCRKFQLHFLAHFKIERAERLVQQQNFGFANNGACNGDALLLTARQARNAAIAVCFEVDQL